MPVWQIVLDVVGALLLVFLCYVIALVARRRLLSRHGGTFELSHRVRSERAGRGWLLGIGRYSGERLEWFRIFSLSPRPKRTWDRSQLSFLERREPAGPEEHALYPDHLVVELGSRDGVVELAMSPASFTGFQSWLEARPPGADWDRNRGRTS